MRSEFNDIVRWGFYDGVFSALVVGTFVLAGVQAARIFKPGRVSGNFYVLRLNSGSFDIPVEK